MPNNERIDRLIRDKLGHLQENPPDFVWSNIVKNSQKVQSEGATHEMDQAIKHKISELTKEPPAYVWNHIQYYLELITIWQNIKRVLLWQRAKRTLKTVLFAITISLVFEYPLNDYRLQQKGINYYATKIAQQVSQNNFDSEGPSQLKRFNSSHQPLTSTIREDNKPTTQHSKSLIVQLPRSSIPKPNDKEITPPIDNSGPKVQQTISATQPAFGETGQMSFLPPTNIQINAPKTPAKLAPYQTPSDYSEKNLSIPLWQVDIGTQFSLMVNQYLFQSLFSNEYITVSPGLISSFYIGRIILAKNHIYRIGILYGGFDSKVAVLIDGRWNKETLESRYLGISGSIGKLLFTTGYRRWIDGWMNTSLIYYIHHMYSSEILRINPPVNKIGILVSGEINYVRGIKHRNMFLVGGRINVLPVNIIKQQGIGKFVTLEIHIGLRL